MPGDLQMRAGDTDQLAAQANDQGGDPIGGVAIAFSSEDPALLHVSEAGMVSAVGPAGASTVVVRSGDRDVRVSVRVRPASPTTIRSVPAASPRSGVVQATLEKPVEVVVTDAYGNPVPAVRVSFKPLHDGGVADPADALTGVDGRARTLWTLGRVAGEQQLAVSTETASAEIPAIAVPGPASAMSLAGQLPLSAPGNTDVQLRARLTDAFGNGISEQPVLWTVVDGGGRLNAATSLTDGSGIAQVAWRLGSLAGTQRVKGTHGALAVEATVDAVLGPPAKVVMELGEPRESKVRVRAFPVEVTVTDAHGNPLAGVEVALAVSEGAGRVKPGRLTTNFAGVASGAVWTPGQDEEVRRLEAQVAGLDAVTLDEPGRAMPEPSGSEAPPAPPGEPAPPQVSADAGAQ